MKVKHLLFSIIAAAFLSSAIGSDHSLTEGKKAPKIETINGTNVVYDANSSKTKKVVSFWSPKNPASRIANRNLSQEYGKENPEFDFISICIDKDEPLMKEVIKIDGVNPDQCFAYSDISPRVFKDYGVEDSPRAFIVDAEGKINKIF